MVALRHLLCVWTLVATHTPPAGAEVVFLERQEGQSVLLPCALERRDLSPFGALLRRTWLRPGPVLFKHTGSDFTAATDSDQSRTSVSGDPSTHRLNVSISGLRVGDTDRYSCQFVVADAAEADLHLPGTTDFFLLVTAGEAGGPLEVGLVRTCVGGSAQVPCPLLSDRRGPVEGVILKRRRGAGAAELLYHSQRLHGNSSSPSAHFPPERIQLSSAPGPAGITYNLSLRQLQLRDSGLYSCQLLRRDAAGTGGDGTGTGGGTTGGGTTGDGLGRSAVFVSVEGGGECSCSSSPVLLYTLSSAVVLLLLLLLVFVVFLTKARRGAPVGPQAPIYEEMAGLQDAPPGRSVQNLCPGKTPAPVNYYATPAGPSGRPRRSRTPNPQD